MILDTSYKNDLIDHIHAVPDRFLDDHGISRTNLLTNQALMDRLWTIYQKDIQEYDVDADYAIKDAFHEVLGIPTGDWDRHQPEKAVKSPLVYIAAPYSGDVQANVEYAKKAGMYAIKTGATPIVPHLLYPAILDGDDPAQRQKGIELDLNLLAVCDQLWLFGHNGVTSGMQAELSFAISHGIRVERFHEIPIAP